MAITKNIVAAKSPDDSLRQILGNHEICNVNNNQRKNHLRISRYARSGKVEHTKVLTNKNFK